MSPLGRRFITVWLGQSLSAIGTVLSGIGVAVYVFLETGSATWLGALAALAAVLLATGVALVGLGLWLGRSWINDAIDRVGAADAVLLQATTAPASSTAAV